MSEILFIAHRIPYPPDRGDKIRSYHIARHLAGLAPLHIACFADDPADLAHDGALAQLAASHCLAHRSKSMAVAGIEALVRHSPVSLAAFRDRRIKNYVARVLRERPISAIYVFSGQMGQYIPQGAGGRVVVDLVDVDSAKFAAYAADASGPWRWLYAREDRLLRAEEARLAARADATLLVSEDEAALLRSRLPSTLFTHVSALGNGIDTVRYDPDQVQPAAGLADRSGPTLIFTGQMDYAPNVAAVVRAAQRIMPRVRSAIPGATFHVVGRQPTAEVLAQNGVNGCTVHGAVDDVRPWLRGADLALVPLEIARGIQNKVLEAMAMGLPVVASPGAATGIAARAGQEITVADSDAALADAVIALLQDPARAHQIGVAARRFVERTLGWDAVLAPLGPLLGLSPPAVGLPNAA